MIERRNAFPVAVDGKKVSAMLSWPAGGFEAASGVVVLAHGAQCGMDHPMIVALAEGLAAGGFVTVRFNFLYREAGRKTPDPQPRLEATWLAVLDMLHDRLEGRKLPLIVGGKSLGAKVGAELVSSGLVPAEAILFYGYPLHRPGLEDDLRDEPIRGSDRPMLFVAGSKDRMCRVDLLQKVTAGRSGETRIHVIDGADHTLEDPRDGLQHRERLHSEVLGVTLDWLRPIMRKRPKTRR